MLVDAMDKSVFKMSWVRNTRFGKRSTSLCLHELLPDGTVYWMGTDLVLVGTHPLDPIADAGREGRLLVREGMREIVEWLGWEVNNEPSSAEILEALRNEGPEDHPMLFDATRFHRNIRY